jgi:hypothetical protein
MMVGPLAVLLAHASGCLISRLADAAAGRHWAAVLVGSEASVGRLLALFVARCSALLDKPAAAPDVASCWISLLWHTASGGIPFLRMDDL